MWRGAYRFSSAALLGRELVVAVVPCGHAVEQYAEYTKTSRTRLAECLVFGQADGRGVEYQGAWSFDFPTSSHRWPGVTGE